MYCHIAWDIFSVLSYSSQACYQLLVERINCLLNAPLLTCACLALSPPTPSEFSAAPLYTKKSLLDITSWPYKAENSVSLSTAWLLNLSAALPHDAWSISSAQPGPSLLVLYNFLSGLLEGTKYFSEHWKKTQKHNKRVVNEFSGFFTMAFDWK